MGPDNKYLLNALEHTNTEVYVLTDELNFQYVNSVALTNLGYSWEEIKTKVATDLNPQFSVDAFNKQFNNGNSDANHITYQTYLKRKDKSLYPIDLCIQTSSVKGEKLYTLIARKISSLDKAETSIALKDFVVEQSLDAIITEDVNGIITFWNKGAEKVFGYSANEIIGKPITTIMPQNRLDEAAKVIKKIKDNGVLRFETRRVTKAGKLIDVSITVSPIVYNGKVIGASKIERDISAFKLVEEQLEVKKNELERQYESLLEYQEKLKNANVQLTFRKNELENLSRSLNDSALVSITDKKGIIIHANEEFRRISKYEKEELLGANHNILNSGYHGKEFWKNMWKTVASGKRWREEVKNKAKDGTYYWVDTVINPIFSEVGKIEKYLSIRYLITDKKESELKNKNLVVELQDALDEKNMLFRELHHRVKNNLQLINSLLFMKLSNTKSSEIYEFIKETTFRINTISRIHDQLLNTNAINQVGVKGYFTELVNSLIVLYSDEKKKFVLDATIEDLKLKIEVVLHLGLIINELVLNIIKYAYGNVDKGKIIINLKESENKLFLVIADQGIGMDIGHLDNPKSFGLQMVKLMTEELNGTLEIKNENGVQYHFIFE